MEGMEYFYELFCSIPRGGPGDNNSTRKAFSYLKKLPAEPLMLDLGCGHGVQTLELARLSIGTIIALDTYQPFLDILMRNARAEGFENRIIPKHQSMLEMEFDDGTFDVIWSEGALYFMGFQQGLATCNRLLKNKGYVAVTEAVLLKHNLPKPLQEFWDTYYPVIMDIPSNIALIKKERLKLLAHFTLPESSWVDNYYTPIEKSITTLKKKYHDNTIALQTFETLEEEIRMYKNYSEYYGYEFFIMQK